MCEKFLIHVHFIEIAILNVYEDLENKELEIDLDLPIENVKIQSSTEKKIFIKNGCQEIESCFILQSVEMIDNEDFMFLSFGKKLNVNLSTEMMETKISKKRKSIEAYKKKVISRGEIDLLELFQKNEENSFVSMEIFDNMEIALSFEITFENSPKISSILSIQIDNFYNLEMSREIILEACIRFPFDENFRAAMMEKSKFSQEISPLYLMDDMLEGINFEIFSSIPSKMEIGYKNYQTELGLNFFHKLIEKKQNLLIEFRIDGKMMMAFLDLDVFNYPGVNDVKLISPLYQWNKNIIKELFQQEASLKVEKFLDKKISTKRKTVETEDDSSLIPIMLDDKNAAISVRITFSSPLKTECVEELTLELNKKFQFIDNESLIEKTLRENNENFKLIIEETISDFEKFLIENPGINEMEIKRKMELIYDKNKFKDIVKVLIGNVYNLEKKTCTNHEFKLLMMEVFKSLNERMTKILNDKWIEEEKFRETPMEDKLTINQIEELMALENKSKIDEILIKQLKNDGNNLNKLEKLAFYQFKLGYFAESEETIMKILKMDRLNVLGLYILSYLAYERDDINSAIVSVKILQKLIPDSMEFLMILKSFHNEINFTAGVKFCNIYLRESKFIATYNLAESLLYPQLPSNNSVVNIMHQQLNFKFHKYLKITKKFTQFASEDFEVKIFEIIEALEDCKLNLALGILKSVEIQDDNEIILRTLKGNLLYLMHDQFNGRSRAVCEYEIAYNLCLKSKVKFPHIPALRSARWYLHEVKNTTKARRYFHYCCKNFATFNSLNEFGIVNLLDMNYKNAEKYFQRANQIIKNCGETWIYLAFVNCKLDKTNIALKCYMKAKNCGVKNCEILYAVERELKI